jgi:tellurite resistance protein TerC
VQVSTVEWAGTITGLVALLLLDLTVVVRRPHQPSMSESAAWVAFYVAIAAGFGALINFRYGGRYAAEFFAGWLTEYSLSADNLVVFMILMSRFAVPRAYRTTLLFFGIVLALVMRGGFIAAGAAAVQRFSWIFYLFGAFLLYTAGTVLRHGEDEAEVFPENGLLGWSRRVLPMAPEPAGARLVTRVEGRRVGTPLLSVMIAIGTADLIFALDSIPAIFGLTREPYLIFTVNALALMGLRQLYFLLGGLLDRIAYLSVGLAAVLGFIGVKMLLEAPADNGLPFVNGGQPVGWAPHVPTWLSLTVIVGVLSVTTVASLIKPGKPA